MLSTTKVFIGAQLSFVDMNALSTKLIFLNFEIYFTLLRMSIGKYSILGS